MTREEALEKFRAEEAGEILKKLNKIYYQNLVEKSERFGELLREGFWKILDKLEEYPEFEIQEVQFSFLRAHIMDGTYQWLVELHDKEGDYTRQDISMGLDMKEIFECYDSCRQDLYDAAAKYVNVLTPADCDLILVDNFCKQVMYLYLLGNRAFRDIHKDERFKKITVKKIFRILIGERKDKAFVIYANFEEALDQEEAIEKITSQPEEKDFNSSDYVMFDFSNITLKEVNVSLRNFPFADFSGSEMDDLFFYSNKCMMTDWRGCTIKNAYIEDDVFNCADFSDSYIENVSFIGSRFDVIPYTDEIPGNLSIFPVSFRGATIKNVDFRGAYLAKCDFRGAEIGRTNFEEADMAGTVMEQKYKDILELSSRQKESITWV